MRNIHLLLTLCFLCCGSFAEGPSGDARRHPDSRIRRAEAWVRRSPRYLHHSQLRSGMTGYGLTVMRGDRRVRFHVRSSR